MTKPKYNSLQNSIFILRQAWHSSSRILALIPLIAALTVAASVLTLLLTPAIIEAVESRVPLRQLLHTILFFAAALMLTGGVKAVFEAAAEFPRMMTRIGLSAELNNKMNTTSYPNTEDPEVRKQFERGLYSTMNDSSAPQAVWQTFTDILTNLGGFAVYLYLLSGMEASVIALVLITTVGSFFFTRHINGWGFRHRDEESAHIRRLRYITVKAADNRLAKDLRIFGMGSWLDDMYNSTMGLYHSFIARREKVYIWGNVIDIVLSFLRNGVAYIYLIYLVMDGGLSASMFLLYFTAVGGLTQWVGGVLENFSELHMHSLEISTIREFLDIDEPFAFEEGVAIEPNNSRGYELVLENVSFLVLKNINLRIPPGEKLAIVGVNGAGKTTLIKLLCGFYEPDEGRVLLNGQDIKQYNRRDYYRHFSAVFQDFSVLATTVADNISQTFGKADTERAEASAALAGFSKSPETRIGKEIYEDGTELSGGEAQRLMLARALYKDAPIIILDEPTAALDPIAERDIYQKYNELCGGKTAVYISHRLASTRFCDRVILIDDGKIAEEGTHESLLAQGGKYAELFEVQSRYYN